ncbi:Syntaxin-4 [Saguinus oedipus]|uniref:Syntaxin-4 n=1 Tax=Saguinus oedipus TaxID=9490 RepID=A0ABQ9ULJ0_SAGOE|nr:Syntaxin-4 [Saguinus oedipus]
MRDRTHELRQGDDSSDEEDKERVALVVHPGMARLGSPDEEFFQKVRTIRQTIVKLGNKVQELEKQQVTILATPLPEESMKQDLQNLRDEIKQLGREIRLQLKAIEPQKEEADENYNSVNTRIRKTQHGVLSQQFVELINKCNSMQSEYREKNVERIRRQLKITRPAGAGDPDPVMSLAFSFAANAGMVSDEELEQMLDSGQSEVFVSNILKDTQVTRQALNEISARHSEIQQLERSIRELHEIFTFLATEVEMQEEAGIGRASQQLEMGPEEWVDSDRFVKSQFIIYERYEPFEALSSKPPLQIEVVWDKQAGDKGPRDRIGLEAIPKESELLSDRGEMINRIEKNILSSADYVERGQEHVKTALENQKKARKKKVLIAICVSIIVVLLAVIIGVTVVG